jgi:pimeloyl-ACP methyl ester carboxylesterase
VDDLEALLDALAFQSVVLVGHSMSGVSGRWRPRLAAGLSGMVR